MFARSILVRAAATSSKDIAKRPTSNPTVPTVSPAVVCSLYRSLYREVSRLDRKPVLKVLFPCNKDLQAILNTSRALCVPGDKSYTAVLREVFRDPNRVPKINLAFDTLNRLRAHYDNVKTKLPEMERDRSRLLASLQSPVVAARRKGFFRANAIVASPEARPKYVQAAPGVPTRVVLREAHHNIDLQEGTLLLAHPLSSAHVDRRVMLITERTPVITSAVVLDLQFTYPLSRGNSMFPEVFWGHDVYDGGFSQIGFTMPPTAQIAVLHTLEPYMSQTGSAGAGTTSASGSGPSMISWLKWKDTSSAQAKAPTASTATASSSTATAAAIKKHNLFCHPLILGGVQDDGTREPTLYLSKAEALPYLSELAFGQPRSSLRIYWGNMRWTTAQLEAEVANGHWMAVKASPSFFRSYSLTGSGDDMTEHFPTAAQLEEAKQLRERRYGANITPPQVFPPDQILRRRECLWDEVMYAMGGDYAALVGCSNPFSDSPRGASVQILAPYLAPLPLTADEDIDTAVPAGGAEFVSSSVTPLGEEDEADNPLPSPSDSIPEHNAAKTGEEDRTHDGTPDEVAGSSDATSTEGATPHQQQESGSAVETSTDAQTSGKTPPEHSEDKNGQ
ncbi:putative mitochondrial hypothetical protein [Leptomonas pyrrhocoris]|uniref:Uncharacterized protein n=1 Tax=Leptomonas pyrrhocoris TaxID=157538 RepID=A0A0M9G950_LEPPY|nr:putative mitochondrial hypothetical protein [Leptomonas pyrrhocoris]XP_015663555.1 putative mitochondrial hypothetical protein [Leptomonas pyrrhocoris]KPA85115.1 putative mitochondrial hypothetical protein [Leptomonas pyrrhocoris]KPA85116.1 putative mitochondrial hypothetical protein [Leptomonas pyrrhocoris]|eukprot:XP_015663554.1 putative mitochondrial hypothetical protein [Leptomonas pyrrhocoris]